MTDLIRKAVELADGWSIAENSAVTLPNGGEDWFVYWPTIYLNDYPDYGWQLVADALAAQLVRQVDALPGNGMRFSSHGFGCILDVDGKPKNEVVVRGPDRTMNTIKAIVNSGVLE